MNKRGSRAPVLAVLVLALGGVLWATAAPTSAVPKQKPECADKIDNDGDGLVDYGQKRGDPDCTSRQDATEAAPFACTDSEGDGTLETPPPLPNARGTCNFVTGEVIGMVCDVHFFDLNGILTDGCEYGPLVVTGPEVCDGIDNDADGQIDEQVVVPTVANGDVVCHAGAFIVICRPGFTDANGYLPDGCEAAAVP